MRNDAAGAAFRSSLPVAGRTGTLRTRMRGTTAAGRCHAKTGTLSDVTSLAGYCRGASGHDIVFAVIMNNLGLGAAQRRAGPVRRGARAARLARVHGQGRRSASRPASSMTSTPRRSAFSSFEPAASPATT